MLALPFLSSFHDPPLAEPVRLTWEFYLRLDFFLRPASSILRPFPPSATLSAPGEARRLSSNGRSATRSNLIRITDATAWIAWKNSRTFCLAGFPVVCSRHRYRYRENVSFYGSCVLHSRRRNRLDLSFHTRERSYSFRGCEIELQVRNRTEGISSIRICKMKMNCVKRQR